MMPFSFIAAMMSQCCTRFQSSCSHILLLAAQASAPIHGYVIAVVIAVLIAVACQLAVYGVLSKTVADLSERYITFKVMRMNLYNEASTSCRTLTVFFA